MVSGSAGTVLAALLAVSPVAAQPLGISPVTLHMAPGQATTSLTVTNQGDRPSAIQLRVFTWNQDKGEDELVPTDQLIVSPPITTIAPSATQVVRLMLRRPATGKEASYRILLDQIPTAAEPGVVQVALRVSMPLFAAPATRTASALGYHLEQRNGRRWLVVANTGSRHETVRDIQLTTKDGQRLMIADSVLPYVLAGATRRWPIVEPVGAAKPQSIVELSARGDLGPIRVSVPFVANP